MSTYFAAQCNEPEAVLLATSRVQGALSAVENALLQTARTAVAMAYALAAKESKLFQALDQEIQAARASIGKAHQRFLQRATADSLHTFEVPFEGDGRVVRVALCGDFGNGGPKARELLAALFRARDLRPDVFIHLGDVYKRGSRREQSEHLIQPLVDCITKVACSARLPCC